MMNTSSELPAIVFFTSQDRGVLKPDELDEHAEVATPLVDLGLMDLMQDLDMKRPYAP